jgi:tRNA-specific 2-thiouridylase
MSGGVDSSVAAALLVEAGYEVAGATMRLQDETADQAAEGGCCSLEAVEDARRVAYRIGIPFHVMDFRDDFRKAVVEPFLDAYLRGETPNPCIACNRYVKFEALLARARLLGFDAVATGHYARVEEDASCPGRFRLLRGADPRKDQSYALYMLGQDVLAHLLLPVGGLEKSETRAIAARLGLAVSDKPDSQEICFIPDDDHAAYVLSHRPGVGRPGRFVDRGGRVLGTHGGVHRFTVGQRKGLGKAFGQRTYVVSIDAASGDVVLGGDADLFRSEARVDDVRFTRPEHRAEVDAAGTEGLPVLAQVRYGTRASPALLSTLPDGTLRLAFEPPVRAVTPGQAAVFYRGEEVLGGGTILRTTPRE